MPTWNNDEFFVHGAEDDPTRCQDPKDKRIAELLEEAAKRVGEAGRAAKAARETLEAAVENYMKLARNMHDEMLKSNRSFSKLVPVAS